MKTYYEILGVGRTATADKIKQAYRAKAKEHHSDKGGDDAVMREVNSAYECLSDPEARWEYDEGGCDPKVLGKRARIQMIAAKVFVMFVERGTEPRNLLSEMKRHVAEKIREKNSELPRLRARADGLKAYLKAAKSKNEGTPDIFKIEVEKLIAAAESAVADVSGEIEDGRELLEFFGRYEFAGPLPLSGFNPPTCTKSQIERHFASMFR